MSYRRESHRTVRLPLLLAFFGVTVVLAGLGCTFLALYLLGFLANSGGPAAVHLADLLGKPIHLLYEGGLLTLGGGWVLMLVGGVGLLR